LDRLNPLVSVVFLNALDFVLNIVPSRIGGKTTDGALLVATPFLKREQIDELIEAQWTAPAELALTNGDFEHADQILQRGLRSAPDSLPLSFLRAVYNVMTGEVERAVLILRPLHVRAHDDPTMRAIVANSLAWSLCLIDDPADREERDALVREAKRQLGEQPAVLSTWGATLLADGRPSEAWPILSNALSKVDEKDQRATLLCNLARAEHQLGLSQQARDRIVEARALNPLNQLLERTERELAQHPRVDTRPRSLPPGTLELSPASCGEPMPTRARIPRWLWVGIPVSLFLWSCVPPYVESALTMGVPYHDLARDPAGVEEQASCAEGLVTLRRWDWLLSRLPSHRGGLPSWREHQVAQLQACTGDLEQAHETLSRLIAQSMAAVDPAELGAEIAGDTEKGWERYAAALSAFESQLSLAHVEERLGRIEAATATLERAERFAGRIDRTGSERPQFGSRSRVARLVAELIQRREGPEAALARIQQTLGRVEGEFPEAELTSLLSLQAELLERLGRTQEADAVFSRIGRATRDSYAMGSSSD
jgi:tetratricopeptide (TPR) repeat protein